MGSATRDLPPPQWQCCAAHACTGAACVGRCSARQPPPDGGQQYYLVWRVSPCAQGHPDKGPKKFQERTDCAVPSARQEISDETRPAFASERRRYPHGRLMMAFPVKSQRQQQPWRRGRKSCTSYSLFLHLFMDDHLHLLHFSITMNNERVKRYSL